MATEAARLRSVASQLVSSHSSLLEQVATDRAELGVLLERARAQQQQVAQLAWLPTASYRSAR